MIQLHEMVKHQMVLHQLRFVLLIAGINTVTIVGAQNVGIGMTNPLYGLHIEADPSNNTGALMAKVNYNGNADAPAITGQSITLDGFGIGAKLIGGWKGLDASATSYTYPGPVYGVYATATSQSGSGYAVFGTSMGAGDTWAGYFQGRASVTDVLSVGTDTFHPDAQVQINVPASGNFPHVRIEAPSTTSGFGIQLVDSLHEWFVGQNVGNWNDGRFAIFPGESFNAFTVLQNGDVGLTTDFFFTPFARLQVPQKGSLNNSGLDLNNAAIYIGATQSHGMAFDENQIESVGEDLYLNFNSDKNIRMAEGGGKVSVAADVPVASFHVGEGHTVLFGKDTVGDGSVGSKFMFFPGKGGAFRAGYLNYDGSVGNGTTFWDPDSVSWASIAIGNNTRATATGATAIGIRTHADNFGAVALGHLSRAKGNSSVAAGYYTRSDAFLSIAVGAGNVGGGDRYVWMSADPIFEVGNSIDTAARNNAFTILKDGKVGIETHTPLSSLHIKQLSSFAEGGIRLEYNTDSDHWETWIDGANDYNFAYNGSLKAYIQDNDGTYVSTSDRRLKQDIRPIPTVLDALLRLEPSTYRFRDAPGAPLSVGFIAQDMHRHFPELVHEKNGYLGINYAGIGVIAVRSIQELAVRQEGLKHQAEGADTNISALKHELNELRKANQALNAEVRSLLHRIEALENN